MVGLEFLVGLVLGVVIMTLISKDEKISKLEEKVYFLQREVEILKHNLEQESNTENDKAVGI